ncbi:MobA/MobL family protein [Brucella pseudogrignonensis]|uniref:MobA/MobL family protein n=1 Tax=Brucella pseudogrignonensis TaxID=419475 RepID=UPI0028B4B614|nr:MobA/MobL family protein [Brucella pseudogrignonensis]MDT6939810.1 MobA/MobL family protein [Brucella pseudogrignonensis]
MKTSLASDQALYHAQAKVFQRSKGRSSVAAAAYRSGTKLTDHRTGETYDYRNKGHVISSFIMAPSDAPAWTQDREELFNRVEASERKSNATVAREWEVSIPRDIPVNEWEFFAREAVAPWVDAGAVADIAIHAPLDQHGGINVHAHIMLTTRKLDPNTDTGFSKKKNDDLRKLHESGGKDGAEGKFGDALKSERERLATVMNDFLERAGSPRRVSHLSNSARGLDQEPEPTMGEQRIHTANTRKKADVVINDVAQHRRHRAMQNALTNLEEEIMSEFPRMQSNKENGIKPRHQQNFKADLMRKHLPDADYNADDLYMVDVKIPGHTRVQMRDGGWLEVDHAARQATVYGPSGQADTLAKAVIKAGHAEDVTRLPETAAITKRGQKLRQRQQATPSGDIPSTHRLPESAIESIADKWRSRGYTNILEGPDGVYVNLGGTRIQDLGTEVRIHGKTSDPAINALLAKASDEWGGELEIYGRQEFKDRLWLEAQRQEIKVFDKDGKPYEPSPEIRAQFEADKAKLSEQAMNFEGVKARKKLSNLLQEAATGDKQALADLRERDAYLHLFLTEHLDAEQLEIFKQQKPEDLEPQLEGFRAYGKDIADDGRDSAAPTPAIEQEPEPKKTKAPQPA